MKDILLKGIVIELGPWVKEKDNSTEVSDNIVYYIGGYLVYSFGKKKQTLRLLCEDHGGRKR